MLYGCLSRGGESEQALARTNLSDFGHVESSRFRSAATPLDFYLTYMCLYRGASCAV